MALSYLHWEVKYRQGSAPEPPTHTKSAELPQDYLPACVMCPLFSAASVCEPSDRDSGFRQGRQSPLFDGFWQFTLPVACTECLLAFQAGPLARQGRKWRELSKD